MQNKLPKCRPSVAHVRAIKPLTKTLSVAPSDCRVSCSVLRVGPSLTIWQEASEHMARRSIAPECSVCTCPAQHPAISGQGKVKPWQMCKQWDQASLGCMSPGYLDSRMPIMLDLPAKRRALSLPCCTEPSSVHHPSKLHSHGQLSWLARVHAPKASQKLCVVTSGPPHRAFTQALAHHAMPFNTGRDAGQDLLVHQGVCNNAPRLHLQRILLPP